MAGIENVRLGNNDRDHPVAASDAVKCENRPPPLQVSRAILLCLGYGLCSLFSTSFPGVVSQYLIHAQLRSPPRRSERISPGAWHFFVFDQDPMMSAKVNKGFTGSNLSRCTLHVRCRRDSGRRDGLIQSRRLAPPRRAFSLVHTISKPRSILKRHAPTRRMSSPPA
jgi:hypothetical protein